MAVAIVLFIHLYFFVAREYCFFPLKQDAARQGWPAGTLQKLKNGNYLFGDYQAHRAIVERILNKTTSRPYTQEGQKEIFKNWIPTATQGLPHAYSPTTGLLLAPFVWMDVWTGYYVYVAINLALLAALLNGYLLPRARNNWELAAIGIFCLSLSVMHIIGIGQTAILTLGALALLWHLVYDPEQKRLYPSKWFQDVVLGVILFLLSAKPPMALLAGAVLLGARRWRAASLGAALFAANFTLMLPYYGGWPYAVTDYLSFLQHYNREDLEPFFRECLNYGGASDPTGFMGKLFGLPEQTTMRLCQLVTFIVMPATIVLAWLKKIGPSTAFQIQLTLFLIASPFLRTSEDIAIVLLVAEGCLFGIQSRFVEITKLILFFLLMNLIFWYGSWHYPIKLIMLFIVLARVLVRIPIPG